MIRDSWLGTHLRRSVPAAGHSGTLQWASESSQFAPAWFELRWGAEPRKEHTRPKTGRRPFLVEAWAGPCATTPSLTTAAHAAGSHWIRIPEVVHAGISEDSTANHYVFIKFAFPVVPRRRRSVENSTTQEAAAAETKDQEFVRIIAGEFMPGILNQVEAIKW